MPTPPIPTGLCGARRAGHICTLARDEHELPDRHECFCGMCSWIARHQFRQRPEMAPGVCWCGCHPEQDIHFQPYNHGTR